MKMATRSRGRTPRSRYQTDQLWAKRSRSSKLNSVCGWPAVLVSGRIARMKGASGWGFACTACDRTLPPPRSGSWASFARSSGVSIARRDKDISIAFRCKEGTGRCFEVPAFVQGRKGKADQPGALRDRGEERRQDQDSGPPQPARGGERSLFAVEQRSA